MTTAPVASPEYALGETVRYRDQHGRPQTGEVLRIEASWTGWVSDPLIIYSVSHPTYRNNRMYATTDNIIGRA